MKEEPFEGEHWEGIFSPGRVYEGDTSPSSASDQGSEMEDDLSRSGESHESMTSYSSPPAPLGHILAGSGLVQMDYFQGSSLESREPVELLRERQTWREEWQMDVKWNRPFNTADPSTFAAAVSRLMEPGVGGRISTPKVFAFGNLKQYSNNNFIGHERGRCSSGYPSASSRYRLAFDTLPCG